MSLPHAAAPQPGAATAQRIEQGRIKAENQGCFECHGPQGQGSLQASEVIVAKLAGQSFDYLQAQVRSFRSGLRRNDYMTVIANTLDDADIRDLAAYFASQAPMHGDGNAPAPSASLAAAKQLAWQGDPARGLPACASCHGEQGAGPAGKPAPRLAGQDLRYLQKQLLDWRSGQRQDTGPVLMAPVARFLSDAEIDALAVLYAQSH
ncbi:MAG: c-type cytochrome [Burkholderiaceae bacterium]|nr:c-type cytochrome [Roseateles sp.]MBV8470752.1 c-type cytochrome [Burkholderiaceae bacterium]